MVVRDVFAPKPGKVTDAQVDQVKETMEHINVVDATIMTADKLAGGPGYREELQRKDEKIDNMERRGEEKDTELHEARLQLLKVELGTKIDELKQNLASGAPKPIGEQITEIKEIAANLGLAPTSPKSTVQEMSELMTFVNSINPNRSLADQIKEAREVIQSLEGPNPTTELPASIALEMKKLELTMNLQIEEMKDARDTRDKEWQLKVKQFDIDTELRRQELANTQAAERERNAMLSGGIEKVGAVVARGIMESGGAGIGGGEAAGPKIASQIIEAAMGEFGETTCPVAGCSATIPIARDAVKAVCPGCNTIYTVKRVAAAVGVEE